MEMTVATSRSAGRTSSQLRTLPVNPCSKSSGGPSPSISTWKSRPLRFTLGDADRNERFADGAPDGSVLDHVVVTPPGHLDHVQTTTRERVSYCAAELRPPVHTDKLATAR